MRLILAHVLNREPQQDGNDIISGIRLIFRLTGNSTHSEFLLLRLAFVVRSLKLHSGHSV
jgi:hypothetical protein